MGSFPISFTLPVVVMPKHDGERCWTKRGKRIMENAVDIKAAAYTYTAEFGFSRFNRTREPVIVHTWFTLVAPKRMRGNADVKDGILLRSVTPDTDNLRKQVLDAIEDLFFYDDRQVVGGVSLKTWGLSASVRFVIDEADSTSFDWMVSAFEGATDGM